MLGSLYAASGATTALDLFTGTTRVAQELKRRGGAVTACDTASYSEVLAQCYIELSADEIDETKLDEVLADLDALPGEAGYFTETFCERSRYVHPSNGARVDAMRDAIERDHAGTDLYPILLTALLLAADRVDSTTGLQMAYLKEWAPRALRPIELRRPALLPGGGRAIRGDALDVARTHPSVDFAYLDPPYNQHRYFSNYHVWETLVRWDRPEVYGVACKRVDARSDERHSAFNSRREMPEALAAVIGALQADVVVLSYNDEAWLTPDQLLAMFAGRQRVELLSFDSRRYIGAQIGIHSPDGRKVGQVSHVRNQELVVVAGPAATVERMVDATR
jgi:adenine-specific DNA-methyltransferase